MATTRSRLTLAYAGLLIATLVAFAIVFPLVYRTRADSVAREADRQANLVVESIRQIQPDTQTTLTVLDTAQSVVRPTQFLIDALDRIPGHFLVFNNQGMLLYASAPMKRLSPHDQDIVNSTADSLGYDLEGARLTMRGDSLRLFMLAKRVASRDVPVPNVSRVVVGVPTTFAELISPSLVGTIVMLVPIAFIISMIVGHAVIGNVFQPVDDLINQMEAITDGRSLHRRLPVDASNDELARISQTLNAMLGRLEDSFAGLRRFTADASHELKTPLTVLRADVERAMHPTTHRGDRMVALEEALQETARMADLVDSLLTLARADEGRFDLHRTPVELEPLLREVYETAVILGEEAGLTLAMPAPDNVTIMGDRARLRQLLLNLITNAIKYTPRGGHVELQAKRTGDEIAISVRDTGIGIAAADLPNVFDRFWRADRARSRRLPGNAMWSVEHGGFGLGLAISQWIAQAHGGTLTAQSRLGRGSIFTVTLPVAAPESVAEETTAPEEARPAEA
jgi:two-component system OmpR family sensor kinase